MNHRGTQTLNTNRLILRKFTCTDTAAMYSNWASDDQVTKFLTWPTHSDITVTRRVIDTWIIAYRSNSYYNWAIVLKENEYEPIGNISVVKLDDELSIAEIGYCVGSSWWHQGITSEALQAVIQYLFHVVGVNRIQARYDTRNPNSGLVMLKCGMKYEGPLRSADKNNQGICVDCTRVNRQRKKPPVVKNQRITRPCSEFQTE